MAPGLTRTGHDADFSSLASQELQQGAGRFTAIGVVTADITLAAAVLYVIIDVDDENALSTKALMASAIRVSLMGLMMRPLTWMDSNSSMSAS